MELQLTSTITCPNCVHTKEEQISQKSCSFFYKCENCKTVLRAKEGDCIVYCSYGSNACPSIQEKKSCC